MVVRMRPKLNDTPVPVERASVGKSSGRYSGSQPKKIVETKPTSSTIEANPLSSGTNEKYNHSLTTSVDRLITKYIVRRPNRSASQPPNRLPTAAPPPRMITVRALAL